MMVLWSVKRAEKLLRQWIMSGTWCVASPTNPGTCGGHHYGDSGAVESSGAKTCKWLLRVDDGFGIKLSMETFSVTWKHGIVRGNMLTVCLARWPAPAAP